MPMCTCVTRVCMPEDNVQNATLLSYRGFLGVKLRLSILAASALTC